MHPLPSVGTTDEGRSRDDDPGSRRSGFARIEVADYLKIIRKRIWLVLLVPAVAVALVVAVVLSRPTEYSATATVSASSLISNAPGDAYATANGGQQFVADFVAALSVPPVVDAAAARTGTSPEEIQEGISAGPIGESTLIQVRYVTNDERLAGPVVRELSVEALRFLFRPAAATAEPALDEGSLLPTQRLELLLEQDETVTVSPTEVGSRGPDLIRGIQVAIGGGLLLGLLVVILLEILPLDRLAGRTSSLVARIAQMRRGSMAGGEPDARGDTASMTYVTDARVRTRPPDPPAERTDDRAAADVVDHRRSGVAEEKDRIGRPGRRADEPVAVARSASAGTASRQPAEPSVEPLPAQASADGPDARTARRRTTKPRTTKPRRVTPREPNADGTAAAPSAIEAGPGSEATTETPPHADAPPTDGAPPPAPPKARGTRKRRPSRADARRATPDHDGAQPAAPPVEPSEDMPDVNGPAHDAGTQTPPPPVEHQARDA